MCGKFRASSGGGLLWLFWEALGSFGWFGGRFCEVVEQTLREKTYHIYIYIYKAYQRLLNDYGVCHVLSTLVLTEPSAHLVVSFL